MYLESALTSRVVYSDSSNHASGALKVGTYHVTHRMFTKREQAKSSIIFAAQFGIISFKSVIQGCNVKCFTDNQSAMKITHVCFTAIISILFCSCMILMNVDCSGKIGFLTRFINLFLLKLIRMLIIHHPGSIEKLDIS